MLNRKVFSGGTKTQRRSVEPHHQPITWRDMADVDLTQSDTLTFTETPDRGRRSPRRMSADRVRRRGQVPCSPRPKPVTVRGVDPLLARPLYALIETPPLTATIIDYLEQIEDSDWRESGIDIDICPRLRIDHMADLTLVQGETRDIYMVLADRDGPVPPARSTPTRTGCTSTAPPSRRLPARTCRTGA
jgi:hypothetical protein